MNTNRTLSKYGYQIPRVDTGPGSLHRGLQKGLKGETSQIPILLMFLGADVYTKNPEGLRRKPINKIRSV